MTREVALGILTGWVKSPSLLRHCQCVEQVMRCAASRHGASTDDPEKWGLAGLLHDADWESWPEEHPNRIVQLLRDLGEEELAYAISAHGTSWGVPHRSPMDRALVACDELCGFVVCCALLRPNGILTLETASVLKKLTSLRFAAGVDRGEIAEGARLLGVDLGDHIAFVIDALRQKAMDLGLAKA